MRRLVPPSPALQSGIAPAVATESRNLLRLPVPHHEEKAETSDDFDWPSARLSQMGEEDSFHHVQPEEKSEPKPMVAIKLKPLMSVRKEMVAWTDTYRKITAMLDKDAKYGGRQETAGLKLVPRPHYYGRGVGQQQLNGQSNAKKPT